VSIAFVPLLPLWLLAALGLLGLLAAALRIRRSLAGAGLRLPAACAVLLFLAGPEARQAEAEPLSDVAVILTDDSVSMSLGGRSAIAADAADRLAAEIEALGTEVRRGALPGRDETALAPALTGALGGVPRGRLSGIFVITDGQLEDVPDAASLGLEQPLHTLLAGDPAQQRDRRIEIVRAPRYGVVGENVDIVFRLIDEETQSPVPVALFEGGEERLRVEVIPGQEITASLRLDTPGETVVEMAAPAGPGELTVRNNRAALRLTAIRDRLRVLLVSGEPHAGERVWRNSLKSDPAVDLVHFTILKPFDKDARAESRDLNLIPFPHQELFLDKLPDFDVVIFDRYTYRRVLQSYEFERLARYVENGGAVLVSSGPEFASEGSLAARQSLAYILPALPTGPAVERPFVPKRSEAGLRHPVTAALGEPEDWGRWLRIMPARTVSGDTVLEDAEGRPLLVLDRVGEGRIAVLMSDHVWLWSRGFDGGGPYRELLRRLVHWLMQEPMLDEEALTGALGRDGTLVVERRSLAEEVGPVEVERPDGTTFTLPLTPEAPGRFTATASVDPSGLYRLRTLDEAGLFAVATVTGTAPREWQEVLTTPAALAPLSDATGGGVFVLGEPGGRLPGLRQVREGAATAGAGWAGLERREAERVTAVNSAPLLPRWAWLVLALGLFAAAWWAEGRR
jgi:hypothetical protein